MMTEVFPPPLDGERVHMYVHVKKKNLALSESAQQTNNQRPEYGVSVAFSR